MSVGPEAAAAREHEAESSRPLAPGSDAQVSQPQPSLLRPEGGAPRPLPAPGGPGPSWAGVASPLLHVPAPPRGSACALLSLVRTLVIGLKARSWSRMISPRDPQLADIWNNLFFQMRSHSKLPGVRV